MDRIDNSEINAEIIDKFTSFESFRSQFEEKALEYYKLFVGYKEEYEDEEDDGKSNLHIPKSYEIVDTIRARLVKSFFGQRPYVDFIPQPQAGNNPQMMEVNDDKAEVAAALVDMQLDNNDIIKKFYDFITSLLVFPASIMAVGWKYEEQMVKKRIPRPQYSWTLNGPLFQGWADEISEEMEVTFDDNYITHVDFFDFWPDPEATSLEDCRAVFQREWLTKEELKQQLEFLEELGEGQIYPVNLEELAAKQSDNQGRWERMNAVGISSEPIDAFSEDKDKESLEVLHYWENDRHAILVNREQVVYDGPSPYWRHRELPFVVATYDPLPNEFYGRSAVDLISDLQHELNTQRNQKMDNINLILNKMFGVKRGADVDESELVSRPGGVIHMDHPDDVWPIEFNDVVGSAFGNEEVTSRDMQNATGTPAIVRGASGDSDQTATEAMKKSNNAGLRFDVKIMICESTGIKRLMRLMDMNNQQFISDSRLIKLGPTESVQWREIQPGEVIGEFDYRPAVTKRDPAANKQVRREQLTQMMQFLLSAGIPYVDMYELVREWIQSFDVANTEKFLIPREVVQQQQAMQQAQQQQAQQQPQKNQQKKGQRQQPPKPPLQGGRGGRM